MKLILTVCTLLITASLVLAAEGAHHKQPGKSNPVVFDARTANS